MVEYNMNGAWHFGDDLSKKAQAALKKIGVSFEAERREDGLYNVDIAIDETKLLSEKAPATKSKKTTSSAKTVKKSK